VLNVSLLSANDLLNQISNIVHQETQLHDDHIDLTVSEVHKVSGAGYLDFGGSEFKPAITEKITPEKRRSDDDYGWWKLGNGPFRIIFNESLTLESSQTGIISSHRHSRQSGLVSNTNLISSEDNQERLSMNITVSEAGCNIKENARIATLRVLEN